MVLSETEEIYKKHQQLCADLNLDKESNNISWNNYVATKRNYTLEGNQLHWLACSIYVACRKSSVPAIGRTNTLIEGNLVSLTRLLRICDLTLIQFIEKCRKWANMGGLSADFRSKINCLERKFAVSALVFKKFRSIFYDMFNQEQSTDPDKMKVAKKGKGITCTTTRLMEFAWTLYLVVKSEYPDISEDLVNSFHLLLACCDMIYANAISSDRRDILNEKFIGLPEHSFDEDYDPPVEPICIIDELCKIHEGIVIDAKGVREYNWKPQIRKLFERGILKGDSSNFTEIFHPDVFDLNYRSVNKCYEQYVLSVGDFDERVMVLDQADESSEHPAIKAESAASGGTDEKSDSDRASIIYPNTLTPLTGRQYLKNRDSLANVSGNTPMINASENVIRLQTILNSRRTPLSQSLRDVGKLSEQTVVEIETEIKRCVAEMRELIIQYGDSRSTDFIRRRVDMAEKFFFKLLDDIAQEEIKMNKPDIGKSLKQDLFLRSLFGCAMEVVVFAHTSSSDFSWILEALHLEAYHYYKIIELVVRTEIQLSRDMVKHLNMVEEKILETMSWESSSPLWTVIDESNLPIPACEEVCLPHQLSSFEASQQQRNSYSIQTVKSGKLGEFKSVSRTSDKNGVLSKPKRGGSLGLFFRKFYHLASVRMQDLCEKLNINDKEVRLKIWTCFEYVIKNHISLMKNRHLDQILMCTLYVVCKVLDMNLTFHEIMKCYRSQPQAVSSIYRNVLVDVPSSSTTNDSSTDNPTPQDVSPGRGDLIKFYNKVYVKVTQSFAWKLSTKSNQKGDINLTPIPMGKSSKTNSPYRRVSDKHPIFIRCLDNTEQIPPSPIKPLSYYFSRSPAKDLHAINNMMSLGSVKRNLNREDDDEVSQIKRFVPRNGSAKLQDLIEDRNKF